MMARILRTAAALLFLIGIPGTAAASPIQIGDVVLDPPTFGTLGVVVPVTAGDADYDAVATVRYRRQGGSTWLTASPLLRVRPDTVGTETPPGNFGLPMPIEQFAGSIFGLEAGAVYDIEVTVTDPDGGGGVQMTSGQTRAIPPLLPANPVVVNVTTAAQLTNALRNAAPGHVIEIAAGSYLGTFSISRSGSAANPIVVRGVGRAQVLIDATGSAFGFTVSGSHVFVEEVTISGSTWGMRLSGDQNLVVRRTRITNVSRGINAGGGSHRDYTICDNRLEGRFVWPNVSSATWDEEGIVVTGQGHVVCHNTLSGFGDALGTSQNTSLPNAAIDFFGNEVLWTGDDGFEIDYVHRNVRVFDNRATNTSMGVSVQPSWGGPIYIFRNVLVNQARSPYKFNNDPTGILVYNNTSIRTNGPPGNFGGFAWPQLGYQQADGDWSYVANFQFFNNLVVGATRPAHFTSDIFLGDFDHNGWLPDGPFVLSASYADLADVIARSSYETNGRILASQSFPLLTAPGVDYTTFLPPANVTLSATSNAVNAGRVIPNINDGFVGSAPDLGAAESGRPLAFYGVRSAAAAPSSPTGFRAD